MPSGLPSVLPKWAKAMLKPDNVFFSPVLLAAVDFLGSFATSDASAPSTWRHIQTSWKNVSATGAYDDFITTFDIAKITGGNVQPDWSAADYDTVESSLQQLRAEWLAWSSPFLHLIESRYYTRTFNPLSTPKPFPPAGAPVHVVTHNLASTGNNGYSVPQCAMTHTERTPYRKHWGRVYWPEPGTGLTDATGHFTATIVNGLANQVHAVYDALMAASFFPVIAVTQVDKAPSRSLLTVTAVEVDDVPDVVRRRRPKFATLRNIQPVSP